MIIEFAISEADLPSVKSDLLVAAVSEALRAHRRGHHMFIASRRCIAWLTREIAFSPLDRSLLERIGADFTQTGNLLNVVSPRLRLVAENIEEPKVRSGNIEIGLRGFTNSNVSERSALVAENSENDSKLYREAINAISHWKYGMRSDMDLYHGGGEHIVKVLTDRIADRRVGSCVIDSDKESPSSDVSEKCKIALEASNSSGWPLFEVRILPCRELENMIPLSIYSDLPCSRGKGVSMSSLLKIEAAEDKSGTSLLDRFNLYFDFKLGSHIGSSSWADQKLKFSGRESIEGFGKNIVSQLNADRRVFDRLIRYYKENYLWQSIFLPMFTRLCAIFAAPYRVYVS